MPKLHDIVLKKRHGQHFLCDPLVVDCILDAVTLTPQTNVIEIGPGGGFLTRAILARPIQRLWAFEIDTEWAAYLAHAIVDERFTLFTKDFLTVDFTTLESHRPWTVLANLPYHLTFPILHLLQEHRHLLKEGVLMMQEEVAQKIIKKSGRDYGVTSLFYQRFFEWRLLEKILPTAFNPPPKVFSRLLHFIPRLSVEPIEREADFWLFLKVCFAHPRRTLANNIKQSSRYALFAIPTPLQALRAQQVSFATFVEWWHTGIVKQLKH
jgi:16S rRNA (adenine1518-N6/adenine1519-N6)-dimethyltransferase